MTEGKIEIPPPVGLLDTDSYSAKANRVRSGSATTVPGAPPMVIVL